MTRLENLIRLGLMILGVCVCLSPARAAEVKVQVDGEAFSGVESIVVLPLECEDGSDCRKLQEDAVRVVRKELGLRVVDPEHVAKAVEALGVDEPNDYWARSLTRDLDADAYLRLDTGQNDLATRVVVREPQREPQPYRKFDPEKQTNATSTRADLKLVTHDGVTVVEGHSEGYRGSLRHLRAMLKKAARQGS